MNLLTLEDEKFKTVVVAGCTFKIRFMSLKDKMLIGNRRAAMQGHIAITDMTEMEFLNAENVAIVDQCTELPLPKEFQKYGSCINWEDEELVAELANEIRKHSSEVQEKLKKNGLIARSTEK